MKKPIIIINLGLVDKEICDEIAKRFGEVHNELKEDAHFIVYSNGKEDNASITVISDEKINITKL